SQLFYNNLLLENYPQLIPFSGIKINMRLKISGINDPITRQITEDFENVNINWANNANTPLATIYFEKKGDRYQATINVLSANDNAVVSNSKLVFSTTENVAKEITLRIFNKGGAIVFDGNNYPF
ncbi:MAG TPA: hypothetical protein VGB84_06740, partial [Arachidicoccus sp.]